MLNLDDLKAKKSVAELLEFGIINIDKPQGPTSFDVSDFVRRILGLRKTSHFGTLDPKVTGVLPIALNRACKLTGFFLGENKEYIGIMRAHKNIDIKKIEGTIQKKFVGKIIQKPPVRSRVKRVERERKIISFDILDVDNNGKDFLFKTEVQGGTYIRKLIDDLGKELGIGAHMLELRRTKAGIFEEKESFTLYNIEEAIKKYRKGDEGLLKKMIIPGEIVSRLYLCVSVNKKIINKLFHGSPLFSKDVKIGDKFNIGDKICVFGGDKFIGIFKIIFDNEIFAKPEFVLQPLK